MSKLIGLIMRAALTPALLCSSMTSFAQEKRALCKPVETMSFSTRVHVRCEVPVDGVFWYFAVSTADARIASRMLNLCMVGQVAEKTLSILFDPADQSGVTFGCLAHDCRIARAIGLTESAAPTPLPPPTRVPQTPSPPVSIPECLAKCERSLEICVDTPGRATCEGIFKICQSRCPR